MSLITVQVILGLHYSSLSNKGITMQGRTEDGFKDYVAQELRKSEDNRVDVEAKLHAIELEQLQARILLANNTETTNRVEASVADLSNSIREMLDVFVSWKGAMHVIDMIGKLAKPLGYIAIFTSAVAGTWVAVKTGMGLK